MFHHLSKSSIAFLISTEFWVSAFNLQHISAGPTLITCFLVTYANHYNSSLIKHHSPVCSLIHTNSYSTARFISSTDLSFDLTQKSFCHKELEIRDWPDMHPLPPYPSLWAFVFTFVSDFQYTDSFILSSFSFTSYALSFFFFTIALLTCSNLTLVYQQCCIFSLSFTLIWVILLCNFVTCTKWINSCCILRKNFFRHIEGMQYSLRSGSETNLFITHQDLKVSHCSVRDWELAYALMHVTFDIFFL